MAQLPENDDGLAQNMEEGAEAEVVEENVVEEQEIEEAIVEEKDEEGNRRWLLLLLLLLLLCALCCMCGLFYRYIQQPEPLPEMLPLPEQLEISYPPHYLFSIYGVDKPVGVAASADGGRIYVSETGGQRLIKMFNRDGALLGSFAPPHTDFGGERSPVYMDTDSTGRLFVADRLQHAIFVYDETGNYIDTILGTDLTLSEYVSKHTGGLQPGDVFAYDQYEQEVFYQKAGQAEQSLPPPDNPTWGPLGLRFDQSDRLLITDVGQDSVRQIPAEIIKAASWYTFDPPDNSFGSNGQGDGQFLFPNTAVVDSQGRIHVTDGNNGRISLWDGEGNFLFHFGMGPGESALSLPRGAFIDQRDRLYVIDAVAHDVKVFDVSGEVPAFLYLFGGRGLSDGQFNYPSDITLDDYGRLYIADRENNRIQVWSY